ncbi:arabinose ABC transporter permease [Anopheles sinensis]|uniref:Arabinose ABC transporter permease n=1 Tax=Anopheles sinensis TaxID=74873 RepID=A0A084VZ57_ANOSI|nr:arabinose ABC transporter permease [Anopheles sinensis]
MGSAQQRGNVQTIATPPSQERSTFFSRPDDVVLVGSPPRRNLFLGRLIHLRLCAGPLQHVVLFYLSMVRISFPGQSEQACGK